MGPTAEQPTPAPSGFHIWDTFPQNTAPLSDGRSVSRNRGKHTHRRDPNRGLRPVHDPLRNGPGLLLAPVPRLYLVLHLCLACENLFLFLAPQI
jgi:hypothetical protein